MLDEVLAARIDNPTLGQTAGSSGLHAAENETPTDIDDRVIEITKRLIEFNGLDQ